jgi:NAD-dependent deacetylase
VAGRRKRQDQVTNLLREFACPVQSGYGVSGLEKPRVDARAKSMHLPMSTAMTRKDSTFEPLSPFPQPDPDLLLELRNLIGHARGVVILTGAGVSAESGVPTFRDRDGIWANFDPTELATPAAFARDPGRVWEWYELRRRAIAECDPNDGHRSIARFLLGRDDSTLVTQNVDGLHQRAVLSEVPRAETHAATTWQGRILELHGNIMRSRCSECGSRPPLSDSQATPKPLTPPECSSCGQLLRPDVVWFGELLDATVLDAAFESAAEAEICIVAGTSAVVHPAASIPLATLESGGAVIEVNPEPTPLTGAARWSLRGPSGRLLPRLLDP